MNKVSSKVVTFVILMIGVFWLFTTGFQIIAPALEEPPLVYRNQPFKVEGTVYVGGPLRMIINRCNVTDRTFDFDFVRILNAAEGGRAILLNTDRSIAVAGTCIEGVTNFDLPDDMRPGRYKMIGIITAPGRFRQEFKIPYQSEEFDVLPKESMP